MHVLRPLPYAVCSVLSNVSSDEPGMRVEVRLGRGVRRRGVAGGGHDQDRRRALHLHVTELVALGRERHAGAAGDRPVAAPRRERGLEPRHVGELLRGRRRHRLGVVDAVDHRVGLDDRRVRPVGRSLEVLVGEREQRAAPAVDRGRPQRARQAWATRAGRRARTRRAVSSALAVSTPVRVTPLRMYDAGSGSDATRAMSPSSIGRARRPARREERVERLLEPLRLRVARSRGAAPTSRRGRRAPSPAPSTGTSARTSRRRRCRTSSRGT